MPSLEELVALTISRPTGCAALEGEARSFLSLLRAKVKDGTPVITSKVREILKAEWGVRISDEALRNHLKSTCNCEDDDG